MTDVYTLTRGTVPLLISVPHDGRMLAPGMQDQMTPAGLELPDTDWHVNTLYAFADGIGASILSANYSRYVVDLNRSRDDDALYPAKFSTGLCPQETFAGAEIYEQGYVVSESDKIDRIETCWQPYHDCIQTELDTLKRQHGYALLWDAHSIPGVVPLLFDGELPNLNLGTNGGSSCADVVQSAVEQAAESSSYSTVLNGRFKGGYITRHYGNPAESIHAIQLELSQRCYMDEKTREYDGTRAAQLLEVLKRMLSAFIEAGATRHGR
jgi:N-formylglutamate deformylase